MTNEPWAVNKPEIFYPFRGKKLSYKHLKCFSKCMEMICCVHMLFWFFCFMVYQPFSGYLKSNQISNYFKFTCLGSSVTSTETDINTWLAKAWMAIDRLSVIWKPDLTDKIKCSFFQAAVISILLYGCTTWTLTKWMEKKLDGNYSRMLRAILNETWRQQPTKQQLYGHLPLIM